MVKNTSTKTTAQKEILPAALRPLDKFIEIKTTKKPGSAADVFLHEVTRQMDEYNSPIECEAKGKDVDTGNDILVNTLGRWLFGVPGYHGNLRIVAEENVISVYYSDKSPSLVHDFLTSLKKNIENKKLL